MASSTRLLLVFMCAVFLTVCGCGGDSAVGPREPTADEPQGTADPGASPASAPLDFSSPGQAAVEVSRSEQASGSVAGGSRDHDGYSPVGPLGAGSLLMRSNEVRGQPTQYWAWMPGVAPSMAWTVPNEVQDIPAEGLGDKIVAVRQGFVAPLADWKLIVRNLDGSHPCILSQSDVNSYSRDMLQRGFPGLAPRPSLDGRNLVWAERFVDEQGQKAKRVQAYDLSTGQLRTLAETTDVAHADLWAPTVSGDTAGWLEQQASGEVRQVLVSLSGGPFRALTLPKVPVQVRSWMTAGFWHSLSNRKRS